MRSIRWPKLSGLLRPRERPSGIIVGLGNPGQEYAETRHNAGFWCVDRIADTHAITFQRKNRSALIGEGHIETNRVVLAKPRTFVNRSGSAVVYLLSRYRVSPQSLLVIYDDVDLPLGTIRLRPDGSAGGHKGMTSIIDEIGTQAFPRLRIGIGRPPAGIDQIEHVLGAMSADEKKMAEQAISLAAEAAVSVLTEGLTAAMNRFN